MSDNELNEPRIVMGASICGRHYNNDCLSCASSLETNNSMLDKERDCIEALTADNARLMAVANEKVAECEIAWAALERIEHRTHDGQGFVSREVNEIARTALAQKDNGNVG